MRRDEMEREVGVGKTEWVEGGCESVVQKDSAEQSGER